MIRAGLALVCLAGPALAEPLPGAIEWLLTASNDPDRRARLVGHYALDGSGVAGLDPLTLAATTPTPTPSQEARFFTVTKRDSDMNTAIMLVLDDDTPACGRPAGVIPVDTALVALANTADIAKLTAFSRELDGRALDLYQALEPQLPGRDFAGFVTLPDGTRIAVANTGADGGYQVFRLQSDTDKTVAFYVDFTGNAEGEWIDPPPCANV